MRIEAIKTYEAFGKLKDDWEAVVAMAGNCVADYTGFICRPECDDKVIPAFAASYART